MSSDSSLFRSSPVRLGLSILAVAFLALWALWTFALSPEGPSSQAAAPGVEGVSARPAVPATEAPVGGEVVEPVSPQTVTAPAVPGAGDAAQREGLAAGAPRPLEGRVVSNSEPLAGVRVAWTSLRGEWETIDSPREFDLEELRGATIATRTDADGRFRFESLPPAVEQSSSVVWMQAPGFAATWTLLGAGGEQAWDWPAQVELAPCSEVVARVVRDGVPVAGATVLEQLVFWDPESDPKEQRAQRVFLFEVESDERGEARLVHADTAIYATARLAEERSMAAVETPSGEEEARIELELLRPIRARGRVLSSDAITFSELKVHGLVFDSEDQSDVEYLDQSYRVADDGTFGPDNWYAPARRFLGLRVSGGGLIPQVRSFDFPDLRDELFVEFNVQLGHSLSIETIAPDRSPLAGVEVQAYHAAGDAWPYLGRKTSDDEGHLELKGLPAGQIALYGTKSGHVTASVIDERSMVPREEDGPVRLILPKAGIVDIFVLQDEMPVPAFGVVIWRDDMSYFHTLTHEDSEGNIRLEDVPSGQKVHVYAFSKGSPQSETETIVAGEEPIEVVLSLPQARLARGRVVDALTGQGVGTAQVQHWTEGSKKIGAPRGDAMPVDPDGRFELPGFAPGRGSYSVSAPGYEGLYYQTRNLDQDVIDLGLLALIPKTQVRIVVVDEQAPDYGDYQAWSERGFDSDPKPLGPDGTVLLSTMSGSYLVHLRRPDGTVLHREGAVRPGDVQEVRFEFGAGIELLVELEGALENASECVLEASGASEGYGTIAARWSPDLEGFLLSGLQPGEMVMTLFDSDRRVLARAAHRLEAAPHQQTHLSISGDSRRLRLVNSAGKPWTNKTVHVMSASDESGWRVSSDTDDEGVAEFGPLPSEEVFVTARLDNEFIAFGLPVTLDPDPDRATTVVIDRGRRCYLRLMEEGAPRSGLQANFAAAKMPLMALFSYTSDEDGRILGPECVEDHPYLVNIDHPGFWPLSYEVFARGPEHVTELELYHRGAVEIVVTDSLARPVSGAAINLQHVEFGETPGDWARRGWVHLPPGGVRTDEEGRLSLEGLPRGSYLVTLKGSDGRVLLEREFALAGGKTNPLELQVPD